MFFMGCRQHRGNLLFQACCRHPSKRGVFGHCIWCINVPWELHVGFCMVFLGCRQHWGNLLFQACCRPPSKRCVFCHVIRKVVHATTTHSHYLEDCQCMYICIHRHFALPPPPGWFNSKNKNWQQDFEQKDVVTHSLDTKPVKATTIPLGPLGCHEEEVRGPGKTSCWLS